MKENFNDIANDIDITFSKIRSSFSQVDVALSESVRLKMFGNANAKERLKSSIQNALYENSIALDFLKQKEVEFKNYITTIKSLQTSYENKKNELDNIEAELNKKNIALNKIVDCFEEKNNELENLEVEIQKVKSGMGGELPQKTETDLTKGLGEEPKPPKKIKRHRTFIFDSPNKELNDQIISGSLDNKILDLKIQVTRYEENLRASREELESIDSQIADKRETLESINMSILENESNLEVNKQSLTSIEDDIREKTIKRNLLNEDIKKLETYKEYLDKDIRKLKPFSEKLEKSKEDFYTISAEVTKLLNERVNLENTLPMTRQNSEIETIKLQDLRSITKELETNLQITSDKKNKVDEELSHSNSMLEKNRAEINALNTQIKNLESRKAELEIIKNEYESSKNHIELQTTETLSKYNESVTELKEKELNLVQTTSMLNEKQHSYNELLESYDELREQTRLIEKEFETAKEEQKVLTEENEANEEKRKLLKIEIEKLKERKAEIEKSIIPFENRYTENQNKILEQEKTLEEIGNNITEKENEFTALQREIDDKLSEFQILKESYDKTSSEIDEHNNKVAFIEAKGLELEAKVSSLNNKIDKLEEKKTFLETSMEPYKERIIFDANQQESINNLRSKTDELISWFDGFKANLPQLNEAKDKLPKMINQNFNDLKEIFNKINDLSSKYTTFSKGVADLEATAIKGNPKVLDVFFKNRDLAMKEQERIYKILNIYKQTDTELKGFIDLYAMMQPADVLNSTSQAVDKNLNSLTEVLQKLDFESIITEINNNVKTIE